MAFVGKGGAGKSVIAGTLARLLGREGGPVLVVDSDPLPGLAYSIGMPSVDSGIPDEAVEEVDVEGRRRYRLAAGLSADEAVRRYAAVGPDGVRVLQFGKTRGHIRDLARSQAAFHAILDDLPVDGWSVVGDLPGGTRQAFFGWGRYATTLVAVAEASAASLLSARRLARLARMPQA
ncbi:MAG: hypothetical protein H0V19_09365, partial [Euzebyales bacterium]|nr:hypothetical protein [Euzebyales bacterium]